VREWADDRNEPTPLHYALPRLAEDVARFLGVRAGCASTLLAGSILLRLDWAGAA
jgi:hypothetical protein